MSAAATSNPVRRREGDAVTTSAVGSIPNKDRLRIIVADMPSLDEMIATVSVTADTAEFLESAARAGCPIVVVGLTRSGRDELFGALCGLLCDGHNLSVYGCDVQEAQLPQASHVLFPDVGWHEVMDLLEMATGTPPAAIVASAFSSSAASAVSRLISLAAMSGRVPDSATLTWLLQQAAPIFVTMEQSGPGYRVVEIAEVVPSVIDGSLPNQGVALAHLWIEDAGRLVHSGHYTRHSSRIRAHGWLDGERYWIAPEMVATISHDGAGDYPVR